MTPKATKRPSDQAIEGAGLAKNRVVRALGARLDQNQKGLMPFICGGYPTLESTSSVLPALARAGADVVEIGIPFSDPIADGPTIARAMHESLRRGVTPADIFGAVASARASGRIDDLGIVAMVSVSIVWRIGIGAFIERAKEAGIDGFVFPDASLEESGPLLDAASEAGLTASLLVAPTTPPDRAKAIARASTGFVYVLARMGITGDQRSGDATSSSPDLRSRVASLRGEGVAPIACGFGIAGPDDVAQVLGTDHGGADAAIVGSALVRRMGRRWELGDDPVVEAESFVRSLRSAADRR